MSMQSLFRIVFPKSSQSPCIPPLKDPKSPSSLKIEKEALFLYLEGVENQCNQLYDELSNLRSDIEAVSDGLTTLTTHSREWILEGLRTGKLYNGKGSNMQKVRQWLDDLTEKIPASDTATWSRQVQGERYEFEKTMREVFSELDERLGKLEGYVLSVEKKGANLVRRGIVNSGEYREFLRRVRMVKLKVVDVKAEIIALKLISRPLAIRS